MVLARLERKRGHTAAAAKQISLGAPLTENLDAAPKDVGLFWAEAIHVAQAQGDDKAALAARDKARRAFESAGSLGASELEKLNSN